MRTREFLISTEPTASEVQYLEDRVSEYNSATTGITDGEWLSIVVRDDDDRIVAGICGNVFGGCAEIRQFWVEAHEPNASASRARERQISTMPVCA